MYIMKDHTKEYLESNGFKLNQSFSNKYDSYYTKRFVVYRCNEYISLIAEIRVDVETGVTWIDVFDCNSHRSYYASYYIRDYGQNRVVDIVDKNLAKEIKKYNIVEIDENDIDFEDPDQLYKRKKYNTNLLHKKRTIEKKEEDYDEIIDKARKRSKTSNEGQ